MVALTVAYVALLPNFYTIFSAGNRFNLLWNHEYHAAILTAIFVFGLALFVGFLLYKWIIARFPGRRYIAQVLLYSFLVCIAVRTLVSILDRSGALINWPWSLLNTKAAKLLYYLVIPMSLVAILLPLARRAIRRFYVLISPAVLFLMVYPLVYKTWTPQDIPLSSIIGQQKSISSSAATTNIFVFFFDGWSYPRTFPEDRLWPEMTNLNSLLQTSTLYTKAYSPGSRTGSSIPRFLFQNDAKYRDYSYDGWRQIILSQTTPAASNIFSGATNYFRVAVGFWMDYPTLLGQSVDLVAQVRNDTVWRGYLSEVVWLLGTQFSWSHFVDGADSIRKKDSPATVWIYVQTRIGQVAMAVMQKINRPTYAFFHFCLPHDPFIWNRAGMKNPLPDNFMENTPENYADSLRRLDAVIGEIISVLKATGKWDSSLIIVTSDHSWRLDPAVPGYDGAREDMVPHSQWRHVPLIVKEPHQQKSEVITEPFETLDLYPTIRGVVQPSNR